MLDEGDIGLDQPRGALVVAEARAGIERFDAVERRLHSFNGTADGFANFFVLLELQGAQMLIDDRNRVGDNLSVSITVVLLLRMLLLNITQLVKQALAQVSASHARWIQLTDDLERFVQIGQPKVRLIHRVRGR